MCFMNNNKNNTNLNNANRDHNKTTKNKTTKTNMDILIILITRHLVLILKFCIMLPVDLDYVLLEFDLDYMTYFFVCNTFIGNP